LQFLFDERGAAIDMSIALVFPGQGSQSVGMLAAFAARYTAVREGYAEASDALGFDLWQLVAEGPLERLNATEFTQPAMLVADVVTARIWRQEGGTIAAVAGHSLGEFAALVCAQVLRFEDAVRLVHFRGQAMQQAVPAGVGAMAAVLGIEDAELENVCLEAAQGEVVEAVNYNTPGQIVIAGHASAVERALILAKQHGAKRAQLLPVSVPAHSSLMRAAAQRFEERLSQLELGRPSCRYYSAVDATEHTEPQDIRATLVRQLASPVRWSQTVRALLHSHSTLIESGPGKVLTSLNKRIDRSASCFALEDPESLAAALAASAGAAHA
jgi:[acyl-carrier-protein] S-malonyltransferase